MGPPKAAEINIRRFAKSNSWGLAEHSLGLLKGNQTVAHWERFRQNNPAGDRLHFTIETNHTDLNSDLTCDIYLFLDGLQLLISGAPGEVFMVP